MSEFVSLLKSGYQELKVEKTSILLAVSGGPDSIALLRGTLSLQKELDLTIVVAHLNHQLRGEKSDQDEKWLRETCDSLEIPLITKKQDIQKFAEDQQIGIEEAARNARYEFLKQVAKEHSCSLLAVAHSSDDQVETILHHILRGTGISGLQGIPRQRNLSKDLTLIRPLLSISRKSVENYLEEIQQEFRIDESNSDPKWTRNRIRNVLLPMLREEFNPKIDEAILRLGNQSVEVSQTMEYQIEKILEKAVVDMASNTVRLNQEILTPLPRNLIRDCFRTIWIKKSWPRQRMGFNEWDKLAEITLNGGSYTFPGTVYVEQRNQLLICRREVKSSADQES